MRVSSLDVRLDGTHVLRGLDLAVSHGEWINIIGPNGAGKTTLLRAVLGLVAYDGHISVSGLTKLRRAERARKVAYVPQTPVIPRGMLVADYVLLGRTPHRSIFAGETTGDRDIAAQVLDRLDLRGFDDRTVQSLSGGERQRTVLARALTQQADVLLLDEPTTALDLGHQQDVLELVDALRRERGLTVIATLHDLTLAARYGDQVAILAGGAIAQRGTPAQVLTAANIAEHFDAQVRVINDPEGPVIVPTTTAHNTTPAADEAASQYRHPDGGQE
ncbi:ABC transporter ATP-binding protein [Candidatus Poriferisodalis sp.]|uniref:ABC transporter ATP-binding protein n=1 Tax=Candidatus Poriferisodalis sp. TaxID=3101277 RepID=UPI003B028741